MKVAMVSEHASPLATLGGVDAGGQNVHVAALAMALAGQGADVVVYTRRDSPDLAQRVEFSPGVEVEHVDAGPPEPIAKDHLLPYMAEFAAELRRRWAGGPPDVVHAHFWMSGLAAMGATAGSGIPVVQTFHALGAMKRRHLGYRDTSPPERLSIEARLSRDADHIVVTSNEELSELLRVGAHVERMSVVPCGVDVDRFSPEGPNWWPSFPQPAGAGTAEGRGRRLLAVSRLVERKGIGEVIAALPALPEAELAVAGGPPAEQLGRDPEATRLAALARDLGVECRVNFLGGVAQERLPGLYRAADVVVCTPWYEPFGMAALEAMACGKPVVASHVGGLVDTVVNDATGLHVPPKDPAALGAALERLLGDGELRWRLGTAGGERARSQYTWSRVAAMTKRAYGLATRSRHGQPAEALR